jgi:hypothetical protein
VTFNGGGFDAANGTDVGPDGHPVVTGSTCATDSSACNFRTIKYDAATGAILWKARFDSGGGRDDEASGVAVGDDGHPVVTGFSCVPDGTACDIRTIKYERATGAIRWNVTFDTGGATNEDRAFGVAIGADNHPVVTGLACDAGFTTCLLRTIKYHGVTGAILWKRTFAQRPFEIGFRVTVGPDNNPVVTGLSCAGSFVLRDIRTIRYKAASGEILWTVLKYVAPARTIATTTTTMTTTTAGSTMTATGTTAAGRTTGGAEVRDLKD